MAEDHAATAQKARDELIRHRRSLLRSLASVHESSTMSTPRRSRPGALRVIPIIAVISYALGGDAEKSLTLS